MYKDDERVPPLHPQSTSAAFELIATHDAFIAERPEGADEDVHMLASLVDFVLDSYSAPGDTVFDPFAGFGTTLDRALKHKRNVFGIELLPERVEQLHDRFPGATVVEGDARELTRIVHRTLGNTGSPEIDLVLTSPPYMTENAHDADPLTAYELEGAEYGRYLTELELVAAQCTAVVRPGGFVVWNVADIQFMGHTTRLIRDCTRLLAAHLTHVDTVMVRWDRYPHDLVADALLIFQRPEHSNGQ